MTVTSFVKWNDAFDIIARLTELGEAHGRKY